LTSILATIPYLNSLPFWGGLLFLWLFHTAVDKAKLVLSASRQKDHLGLFLLDQLLHLGAIGLICLLLSRHPQAALEARESAAVIARSKLGVAYIIAIWVSPLLSFYIRSACLHLRKPRSSETASGVFPPGAVQPMLPAGLWRWLGYFERGCLVAVIAQGGHLLFLTPLILLPRAGLWMSREKDAPGLWELIPGIAVALTMGLWAGTL